MNAPKHFVDDVNRLEVVPPAAAWKRLESKLEAHQATARLRRIRMIGYAASLLVLVIAGVMIAGIKGDSERNDLYTMSIEVLQTEQVADESIYNVENVKDMYTAWNR